MIEQTETETIGAGVVLNLSMEVWAKWELVSENESETRNSHDSHSHEYLQGWVRKGVPVSHRLQN